jgi:hypothetical protein
VRRQGGSQASGKRDPRMRDANIVPKDDSHCLMVDPLLQ